MIGKLMISSEQISHFYKKMHSIVGGYDVYSVRMRRDHPGWT